MSADTSITHERTRTRAGRTVRTVDALPAPAFFGVSAIFHYLGPSFAVLLFTHVDVLGVAWPRIAAAAAFFAVWRRPWRVFAAATPTQRWVLAGMNSLFYLAVDRLPLSTVGAIEFLGVVILAVAGARTCRNLFALLLAVGGVFLLTAVRWQGQPAGFAFAFANCAGFMLYVVLGHRVANAAAGSTKSDEPTSVLSGIDQLGAAMLVALAVVGLVGFVPGAEPA